MHWHSFVSAVLWANLCVIAKCVCVAQVPGLRRSRLQQVSRDLPKTALFTQLCSEDWELFLVCKDSFILCPSPLFPPNPFLSPPPPSHFQPSVWHPFILPLSSWAFICGRPLSPAPFCVCTDGAGLKSEGQRSKVALVWGKNKRGLQSINGNVTSTWHRAVSRPV